MVAVVTSAGLGLQNGAKVVQTGLGQLGPAEFGRGQERVYVNAANGNLVLQRQDEFLGARGADIGWLRTYNSQGQSADPRANWRLGYARQVTGLTGSVNQAGSTVQRIEEDGAVTLYRYHAGRGGYIAAQSEGADHRLDYQAATRTWVWTDGSSLQQERHDEAHGGRLIEVRDRNGQTLSLTYHPSGAIARIASASGETLHIDVDANGNLSQLRTQLHDDRILTRTRYAYDSRQRLTEVSTDLSPDDNSVADGKLYRTRYHYDGDTSRVAGIEQDDGSRLTFEYVEVNGQWRLRTIRDIRSDTDVRTTRLSYDSTGRRTTVTDAVGLVSTLSYDAAGRLLQLEAAGQQRLSLTYDDAGRVSRVTDGLGRQRHYSYDAKGNNISQRDALGHAITRRFGEHNQLLSETAHSAAGEATRHDVYDTAVRVRFNISPERRVTEYRYDAHGHVVSQLNYTQAVPLPDALSEAALMAWAAAQPADSVERTDTEYDLRGFVRQQTRYARVDSSGQGVRDGSESTIQYVHDQTGRLLQRIEADGGRTQFLYDGLHRLVASTDGLGNTTSTLYLDGERRTTVTLANGLTTTTHYDQAGHALAVLRQADDQPLGTTRHQYDLAGRLKRVTDPTGQSTSYFYDELGRKVAELDASLALTEFVYNAADQKVASRRYANRVNADRLAPDPLAWTLADLRPAADVDNDRVSCWLYDQAGRLAKTVDAQGAVTAFHYDASGRQIGTVRYATLLGETQRQALADAQGAWAADDERLVLPTDPARDRHERRFYDRDGLLIGQLDAEGYLSETRYDAAGRIQQTRRYATVCAPEQRAQGTLAALRPDAHADDQLTRYWHDRQGRQIGTLDAEGYLTETRYAPSGKPRQQTRYATALTDAQRAAPALADARPAASSHDRTTLFEYDARQQLIRQQSLPDGLITTFRYDSQGKVLETARLAGPEAARRQLQRFDAQGRLSAELAGEGAAALAALGQDASTDSIEAVWQRWAIRHQYDAAGRRSATLMPGGQDGIKHRTLFFYDANGRNTHTVNALGEVSEIRYNTFGEAIAQRQYANRLAASALQGLSGGISAALDDTLAAQADPTRDQLTLLGYNRLGQIQSRGDALGQRETLAYDAFGDLVLRRVQLDAERHQELRQVRDRRGLTRETHLQAGAQSKTQRTVFDAFGRAIEHTDANGHTRFSQYDRLGRQVVTTTPGNQRQRFSYDAFSRVLAHTNALGQTTHSQYDDQAGTLTLTTPSGVQTISKKNPYGETVQVIDGRGQATQYRYNASGQLIEVRAADGATQRKRYDHAGQLIETFDARGIVTRHAYDAAGRVLESTLDPDGLKLTTRYQYDAMGRKLRVTDPAGHVTESQFDARGQLRALIVDAEGLKLTTRYSYDDQGHTLTETKAAGSAAAQTTRYHYDAQGRRVAQTIDPDGLKLTTRFTYDANDNLISSTDANGQTRRSWYDAHNRPIAQLDANGALTRIEYDAAGRVQRRTAYAKPIELSRLAADATWDDLQALLTPSAADRVERQRHDADGRLSLSIDALGYATQRQYDANGNLIRLTRHAQALAKLGDDHAALAPTPSAADQTERMVYDAANRPIFSIDAMGYVTQREYDHGGLLIRQTRYANALVGTLQAEARPHIGESAPVGELAHVLTDRARDQVQYSRFDAAGRLTLAVDGEGYAKQTHYDGAGRISQVIRHAQRLTLPLTADTLPIAHEADQPTRHRYDGAGRLIASTDAMGHVTERRYDAVGNLLTETRAAGTDAASTKGFEYDAAGRLTAETHGLGSATTATTRYQLDGVGNRIQETNANGHTTTRRFDGAGRLISQTDPLGGETRYTRDAFGNVINVTDPLGASRHSYYDARNQAVLEIDALGFATQSEYNAFGKVERIVRHANAVAGMLTDSAPPARSAELASPPASGAYLLTDSARDQVTRIEHDRCNRQTRLIDALGQRESLRYDAFGNKIGYTNKVGGAFSYQYDKNGRVLAETLPITALDANGQPMPVSKQFEYDARGNRIKQVEAAGLPEQRTTHYRYDALDRLIEQRGDSVDTLRDGVAARLTPTERQRFDARGNLLERTDANGQRTRRWYDALDRKIAEQSADGALSRWRHDAVGNIVEHRVYSELMPITEDGTLPQPADAQNARIVLNRYDANNRLIESRIPDQLIGEKNPQTGNYQVSRGNLITRRGYDAHGHLVRETDARGHSVVRHVDALGRKRLEIDAARYVTAWELDSNGKVLRETRYAKPLGAELDSAAPLATLLAALTPDAEHDRVSEWRYDLLGRVVEERRLGVAIATLDADGALKPAEVTQTTHYAYNGLDKVIQKTEHDGALTDWRYDTAGRETRRQAASFTDYQGQTARMTVDTEYNGLDQVTRTLQRGLDAASEQDDRITRYQYGPGGRLLRQTDAAGHTTDYAYDAVGNITQTQTSRLDADGKRHEERVRFRHDGANRQIDRHDLASGMHHETRYDAHGALTGKRTRADGASDGVWQERIVYDHAGRIVRANSDKGQTKAYFHDANGNATLTIDSADIDLYSLSSQQLQEKLGDARLNLTIQQYDARNQVTAVLQPKIRNARDLAAVQLWQNVAPQDSQGGVVEVGLSRIPLNLPETNPLATGAVGVAWVGNISLQLTNGRFGLDQDIFHSTVYFASADCSIPMSGQLNVLSAGNFRVVMKLIQAYRQWGGVGVIEASLSEGQSARFDNFFPIKDLNGNNHSYQNSLYITGVGTIGYVGGTSHYLSSSVDVDVSIYKQSAYGEIKVAAGKSKLPPPENWPIAAWPLAPNPDLNRIHFKGQPLNTQRLLLQTRPAGSNQGWHTHAVPPFIINGQTVSGQYAFDWSGMAHGHYEMRYLALDEQGKVLNAQSGSLQLTGGRPVVSQSGALANHAQAFMDDAGRVHTRLPSAQTQWRWRVPGGSWSAPQTLQPTQLGGVSLPGWGAFQPAEHGLTPGNTYQYLLTAPGQNGQQQLLGSFRVSDANSVATPQAYSAQPQLLHFKNQPLAATQGVVRFRPAGSTEAYQEAPLAAQGPGAFFWDASALVEPHTSRAFDYQYELFDSQRQTLLRGEGQAQLGAEQRLISHRTLPLPRLVTLAPPRDDAASLRLRYRNAEADAPWQTVDIARQPQGFVFDVTPLKPASGSRNIEYEYRPLAADGSELLTDSGAPLVVSGGWRLGADDSPPDIRWVLTGVANSEHAIERRQHYNAFGEVVREIDGLGHVTDLHYTRAGKLRRKQLAETTVTLENGAQQRQRPQTEYDYDVRGNLVALRDANGQLNRQARLAGVPGSASVEYQADGGIKRAGYDVFGNLRYQIDAIGRRSDYHYDALDRLLRLDRPAHADGRRGFDAFEYDAKGQRIAQRTSADGVAVLRAKTDYDSLGRVTRHVSAAGRVKQTGYQWDAAIKGAGGVVVGGWRHTVTDANGRQMVDDIEHFGRKVRHVDLGERVFNYQYDHAGRLLAQSGSSGQDIRYQYYANGMVKSVADHALDSHTLYEYDANGNKTFEGYTSLSSAGRQYYQYADIRYDELNRVTRIRDPKFQTDYEYDAQGNRRRILAYYHDGVHGARQTQDNWYRYDAMNRFVLSQGQLTGARGQGQIVTGSQGIELAYNAAGERISARHGRDGHREQYGYSADGYLTTTHIDGVRRAERRNDLLGRALEYLEYQADGASVSQHTHSRHDADSKLQEQSVGAQRTHYHYLADGTLSHTRQVNGGTTVNTHYGYDWWDEAKVATLTAQPYNAKAPGWRPGTSHHRYNVNGHLTEARDEIGQRSFRYTLNAQGLVLKRDQVVQGRINPNHNYYYLDGQRVGDVGNTPGPRVDYAQALANRGAPTGRDAYRHWRPISSADFDQNYEPIGPHYPPTAPGHYEVKSGDTLQRIARALWGDSTLWYLLADANGLSGNETLVAGQSLTVPNKVTNLHHNSDTFRVYQPGEAIGNTQPTLPDPPPPPPVGGRGGCGGMGRVFIAMVAVAAVVMTAGAAAVAMGATAGVWSAGSAVLLGQGLAGLTAAQVMGAAVIGAAAGSMISQGAAMAMGLQDRFSWSQVGVAALASGVTAGIGLGKFGTTLQQSSAAMRAMAGHGLTQGAAMAAGLQNRFDWRGVAAAGAAAWAASQWSPYDPNTTSAGEGFANRMTHGMVGGTLHSAVLRGHQPDWGILAAESFGTSLGHASVGMAQRRDAEREGWQRQEGMTRNMAPSSDHRSPMPRPTGTTMSVREQQRILDLEELLDPLYQQQPGMTIDMRGGQEAPNALVRFGGGLGGVLSDAAQAGAQLANDQLYLAANTLTGGLIDDRGAGARNAERARHFPGAVRHMAEVATQLPDKLMYYAAHPDELRAEQWGRAAGEALLMFGPGLALKGARALGATGLTSQAVRESFGPQLDRMVDRAVPGMRAYVVEPGGGLRGGVAESMSLAYKPTSGVLLQAKEGYTTTILGSYTNDIKSVVGELGNVKSTDFGPRIGGFNVLNVPDDLYISPKQFWADYNQPWLSNAINRGDNFLMATQPAFDVIDVKSGFSVLARPNPVTGQMELSGFGREYLMMRRAGYNYQNGVMLK